MIRKQTIILIILLLSIHYSLFAFSGNIGFDKDIEGRFDVKHQFCFINHKDGIQHTILMVNTPNEFNGKQAVQIFPVPAKPENISINVINKFPLLSGGNTEIIAEWYNFMVFNLIRATQIFTMPILILPEMQIYAAKMASEMSLKNDKELELEKSFEEVTNQENINETELLIELLFNNDFGEIKGITVHKRIEKLGLTVKLLSAQDMQTFLKYDKVKKLKVSNKLNSIINEYIDRNYSFLIYGISDFEKYKKVQPLSYIISLLEQGNVSEVKSFLSSFSYKKDSKIGFYLNHIKSIIYDNTQDLEFKTLYVRRLFFRRGNSPSVSIKFPTKKIYFPLKFSSIYGNKIIPTIIYIMDYVNPELYPEIKTYCKINYFYSWDFLAMEELEDFFIGFHKVQTTFYLIGENEKQPAFTINDLKYTKIKIFPPSQFLTHDLWIKNSITIRAKIADFVINFSPRALFYSEYGLYIWFSYWFLLVGIPCSILASLFSSSITLRNSDIQRWKFAFFGLLNSLTLIGFSIATYFLRTKKIHKDSKEHILNHELNLFENSRKKYYIMFGIFSGLTILWTILVRFSIWKLPFWLIVVAIIFTQLILIMNLSTKRVKPECISYPSKNRIKINVIDIKKFVFLFLFNLILSWITVINIERFEFLDKFLRFRMFREVTFATSYEFSFLITILFVFTLSLLILIPLDIFFKKRFGKKGFYIVPQDKRKFWFIALFSVTFIALTVIFQLILKVLI